MPKHSDKSREGRRESTFSRALENLTNRLESALIGNIKLTKGEKSVMENRSSRYGNINRGNAVRGVNWRWFPFFAGFLLAMVLPFLLDLALFGTAVPCETVETFKDGSSVQKCSVRN